MNKIIWFFIPHKKKLELHFINAYKNKLRIHFAGFVFDFEKMRIEVEQGK